MLYQTQSSSTNNRSSVMSTGFQQYKFCRRTNPQSKRRVRCFELAPLPSEKTENTLARWALWGGISLIVFAILANVMRNRVK